MRLLGIFFLLVAKRVLEKEGHRIGNTPLEVAPYTEKAAEYQGNKFSGETTVDNDVGPDMAKTVEIHGEIGNISAESLELYLESTKRSGGGPIEKMDLKASPALVTFKEAAGKKLMKFYKVEISFGST